MNEDDDLKVAEPSELQKRSGAAFDRIIGNTVNTAIATWVATSTGLPEVGATIGGTLGPLTEELSFAIRKIVGLRNRQAELMMEKSAAEAGVSVDLLVEHLVEDPAKLQLLVTSLDAAARAADEEKLDLVAKLLATGALAVDRDLIDEQMIITQTVAELELYHLRLIAILDTPCPIWRENIEMRKKLKFAWPEDRVIEQDAGLSSTISALTAKLQSLGIARYRANPQDSDSELWELTRFGKLCMNALRKRPFGNDLLNSSEKPDGDS